MSQTLSMPITAFYAALSALLIVVLIMRVVFKRRKFQVGIGDGGERSLALAVRAHANAVETIPIALILLALLELNGGMVLVLHAFGTALVFGRVLHALGLSQHIGVSFGRFWGMCITLVVILGLALMNALAFFVS